MHLSKMPINNFLNFVIIIRKTTSICFTSIPTKLSRQMLHKRLLYRFLNSSGSDLMVNKPTENICSWYWQIWRLFISKLLTTPTQENLRKQFFYYYFFIDNIKFIIVVFVYNIQGVPTKLI